MHQTYLPLAPVAVPLTVSVILAFAARSRHSHLGDKDIYELPSPLAYLMAVIGICFLGVPFITGVGGPGPAPLYFIAFFAAFSAAAFGSALWFIRYRVTVAASVVTIRSLLRERVVPFADIIDSDVLVGRQARELVVYLRNGHRLRLSGLLQDFDELVDAIDDARVATVDSAAKLADQQRAAAGRRGANLITWIGLALIGTALIAVWIYQRMT